MSLNTQNEEISIMTEHHSPQNISIYSFGFGTTFGISVVVAYCSESFMPLGIYMAALALFHELEYLLTALFNANKLSLDAFLLNNGIHYYIANGSGLIEFLIELYFFPGLKRIGFLHYLGFTLIVIGQVARTLAMWHAKHNFSHQVATYKRQEHVLVTTGIYAYLRHPSYFGFLWWAVGTQILLCNPFSSIGFFIILKRFFQNRIREEEKLLIKFFGNDYIEYQKRTSIYIPLI
ncbi:hypothetical protein Glove_296g21 [Diversispora epigaea]|uniref:Protein-S-isoprenylcysteine O-methyltransferase n=1 Tax=Diversispora epigaea TaxID=1348612 RepID=A0A397HZ31_9GLOM|nr:hypothetical protein Glove_296g21 [Diversispora epigaea]